MVDQVDKYYGIYTSIMVFSSIVRTLGMIVTLVNYVITLASKDRNSVVLKLWMLLAQVKIPAPVPSRTLACPLGY